MKQILFILFTIVTIGNSLQAQTKDEKAVAAAVETLRKAMLDGDKTSLEK